MHNMPKITVITPSYNQGKFIRETILSIIEQNYSNLEYIIVDGNSTDETIDILNSFKNDKRITKIIVEKDKGQVDALLKGFKMATGDIFGWINSDDKLEEGALSKVATKFITDHNVQILVGLQRNIDENGRSLGIAKRKIMSNKDWLRMPMSINQPPTFFKSEVYRSVGGLNPILEYSMDYDLFMRFAKNNYKWKYIDEVLAQFRYHSNSKTVSLPNRQWKEEFKVFKMNGGNRYSPFYYWKFREIFSFIIKQKIFRIPRGH